MPRLQAELIPAMVTPFRDDFSVDYQAMEKLAHHLLDNGCDGLLVNGTTGESPTLSAEEKLQLVKTVQAVTRSRNVPIMAGVGSNNTLASVEDAQKYAALGVDALLVVVPYYNKPSQRGMIEHFRRIAQAVPDTEIVIYNIPGRCIVQMSADTMAALHAQCPNIIGVKQSCPDMDAVSEIVRKLPQDTWRTWCGDDTLTLPMLACGAYGTVSVAAHLIGTPMREMIQAFKQGRLQEAIALHHQLHHVGQELFFLPNPTVLKTTMGELGMINPTLRPPMVKPEGEEQERVTRLAKHLQQLGLTKVPSLL